LRIGFGDITILSTHSAHNAARRSGELEIVASTRSCAGRCALKQPMPSIAFPAAK
jgi:hypothetical protein